MEQNLANNLLTAIQKYNDEMRGKTSTTNRRIRNINNNVALYEDVNYKMKFANSVSFKFNASEEIVPVGTTANKKQLRNNLVQLRDNLDTLFPNLTAEQRTEIRETIEALVAPLNRAIENAESRDTAKAEERRAVEAVMQELENGTVNEGDERRVGDVTFRAVTKEDGQLTYEVTGRESTRRRIVTRLAEIDTARSREISERVRTELDTRANARKQEYVDRAENWFRENGTDEALLASVRASVRNIGETDRNTQPQDRNVLTATRLPLGTVRERTEVYGQALESVSFRYDRDGEFKTFGGSRIAKERMVRVLEYMRDHNNELPEAERLSDEDIQVVNRLIAALNRALDREQDRDNGDAGRNPDERDGERTGGGENPPTPNTTRTETRSIVTGDVIRERIAYHEERLRSTSPVLTTISIEDARRLAEIRIQRSRANSLVSSIASHQTDIDALEADNSGDAQEQAGRAEQIGILRRELEAWERELRGLREANPDLELTLDQLRDRLNELREQGAEISEINRIHDLITSYEYDYNAIVTAMDQRLLRRGAVEAYRAIVTDGAENGEDEAALAEIEQYPGELELSENQIRELMNPYTEEKIQAALRSLPAGSQLTPDRLEILMRSYMLERGALQITREQPAISEAERQESLDALAELRELEAMLTPENDYILVSTIDERLRDYNRELDELLAIGTRRERETELVYTPEQSAKAKYIRLRMAELAGRDPLASLDEETRNRIQELRDELAKLRGIETRNRIAQRDGDGLTDEQRAIANEIYTELSGLVGSSIDADIDGIENIDEHAISLQMDDNEIDEFQELRDELNSIEREGRTPTERTPEQNRRIEELRNRIAELEILRERAIDREFEVEDPQHDDDDHQHDDDDDHQHDDDDDHQHDDDDDHQHDDDDDHQHDDDDDHQHDDDDDHQHDDDDDHQHDDDDDHQHDDDDDHQHDDDGTEQRMTRKGFWRIVEETSHHDGNYAGSWAITIRNIAKAPLIRPTSIKDGGLGWLGLPVSIMALPVKLVARGIHAVSPTEDKYAQMYEQVRVLYEQHPEDFRTLIEGMREDVMRKNKINGLYLKAVQDVLSEVVHDEIADSDAKRARYQQVVADTEQQMDTMLETVMTDARLTSEDAKFLFSARGELTPDQIRDLDDLEARILGMTPPPYTAEQLHDMQSRFQDLRIARNENDRLDREAEVAAELYDVKILKDFERGAVNKEWGRMNIGITFPILKYFNRNNPNNRQMIERFADEEDRAIAARAAGQEQRALDHEREIGRIREESTNERRFGPFILSRGNAHHERVTVIPNDRDDTRARQLMSNAMIALTGYNFIMSRIHNNIDMSAEQERLDDHLDAHNADVDAHNQHLDDVNAQNAVTEQAYQSAMSQIAQSVQTNTPTMDTYEAFDTVIGGNIQGILGKYHDSFVTLSNQVSGGSWPYDFDHDIHEMIEGLNASYATVKQSADALAQAGDYDGAIQMLVDFNNQHIEPQMNAVMQYEVSVWNQAIASGSQYSSTYQSMVDVTTSALQNTGDMNDLLDRMANGSFTMPTVNEAMATAQHMDQIQGFTLSVPSTWMPSMAALATSIGNAVFGKLVRDRQISERTDREAVEPTPQEGHFFGPRTTDGDGPEL